MAPTVLIILFLVALGECIALMSPLFSVCYSESVSFLVASAVPIFQSTPSDQTVMEGGDVTFSCDATLNGTRRLINYRIKNGASVSVRRNLTNLSIFDSIDTCQALRCVLDGARIQLEYYAACCTKA